MSTVVQFCTGCKPPSCTVREFSLLQQLHGWDPSSLASGCRLLDHRQNKHVCTQVHRLIPPSQWHVGARKGQLQCPFLRGLPGRHVATQVNYSTLSRQVNMPKGRPVTASLPLGLAPAFSIAAWRCCRCSMCHFRQQLQQHGAQLLTKACWSCTQAAHIRSAMSHCFSTQLSVVISLCAVKHLGYSHTFHC